MSTLTDINPADLLVDTNIRTDLNLDTAFTGSIKERGVIVPIVAQVTEEGIRVIAGHRRTAAALAAGLTTVPVVIIDTPGEADRIIDQLAENDHRTGLTTTDRVNAVHQLALLGVSAAQITKRTKITRDTVDAALSLSGEHRELLAEYPITVAAWLAEFADDESATAQITRAYHSRGEGAVRHEVERIRTHRAAENALQDAAQVMAAQYDCTVTTTHPAWADPAASLDTLGLDETDHATCPGHLLVIAEAYTDTACDCAQHEQDEECEDDDADPVYLEVDGTAYTATAYCADWQAHGHTHPWKSTTGTSSTDAQASPEQAEQQRAANSAERRRVIAGNKAWAASHAVRAEFIDQLAQRKATISGGAVFALEALQDSRDLIGTYGDRIDTTGMSPAQATNALVTWICRSRQVKAASDHGKSLWRGGQHHSASIARFLRFLESVGYTLSAAEEAAAGGAEFTLTDQ